MLRGEYDRGNFIRGLLAMLVVGTFCGILVANGNPGNMGICGACFLRDSSGALNLFSEPAKLRYLRPEVLGVVFGAMVWMFARSKWEARSGSHAATRFFFGVWMGISSLVFLGCPFRMIQRIAGGDLSAWVAVPGFVIGVGFGLWLEKRGYNVGKTEVAPAPVGLLGPLLILGAGILWAQGLLSGPGPGEAGAPAHADWKLSLGLALGGGALLSATRFCAVTAARQIFQKDRRMLWATLAMMVGYAAVAFSTGKGVISFEGQPAAHVDILWSALALALVGLCGCLAGGCPVRQLVMTGEGNGDAAMAVMGILFGGALSHGLGLASSGAGTTPAGRTAIVIGLVLAAGYGFWRSGDLKK